MTRWQVSVKTVIHVTTTRHQHWWIFYKDSGAPPLWQKISQLAESEWKIIKNKQISNQISCFYSIFIIIFPIFCQIIQNLAFLAQIVQKYGSLIEKFPKISSAKNESRCRGPWQKIDFFVKYSPVIRVSDGILYNIGFHHNTLMADAHISPVC